MFGGGAQPGHPDTGTHAPKGGIVIAGQFFPGGKYIPKEVLEKAREHEMKMPDKTFGDGRKEIGGSALNHHASPLEKWGRHHAHLRNFVNNESSPAEQKDARKQTAVQSHREMLLHYYKDLKEKIGGDPGDHVRKKLQKLHDYFRERVDKPKKSYDNKRGSYDYEVPGKAEKDLVNTEKQDAKRRAGTLVEWPAEGTLSPHHDECIKKLRMAINKSPAAIHRGQFKKESIDALQAMSPRAAQMFAQNIKSMNFTASHSARNWHSGEQVAGYAHLGGGHMEVSANHPGTTAHEMVHIIDRGFSSHPEWKTAWQEEICHPSKPLSDYATTEECEGLAEFGRLLWTQEDGKPCDMNEVAKTFPKCLAFWKKHIDGES